MKKYLIINWDQAILWLSPPILRKATHISWLKVLLTPLKTLYEDTLYRMHHNGQVISIEKVLNEIFNPERVYNPNYTTEEKQSHNLIYIDETLQPKLKYVYKHEEYYLHNEEEHFQNPITNSSGEVILDEQGFLNPIELFTHHELVCEDPCYSNVTYPIYNTYLATTEDYTKVAYANFRILIPELLNINLAITGAIEVKSPKFHQVVNFYKLAGKTYETYKYNNTVSGFVSPTDICDCDN